MKKRVYDGLASIPIVGSIIKDILYPPISSDGMIEKAFNWRKEHPDEVITIFDLNRIK